MSAHNQIFIRTNSPKDTVVRNISIAAGTQFALVDPITTAPTYWGRTGSSAIDLEFGHDYDDDMGIPFESHPVVLTVRDLESNPDREEREARTIFEHLRQDTTYDMILVFDLQKLLLRTDI